MATQGSPMLLVGQPLLHHAPALHDHDPWGKPHGRHPPDVDWLERVREERGQPERCPRQSGYHAQDSLQPPMVDVVNVAKREEKIGPVDPGPEELPEGGWYPIHRLAALRLSFSKRDIAEA